MDTKKYSKVLILAPIDASDEEMAEGHPESALVHELMHIAIPYHEMGIKNVDSLEFNNYERIIDRMRQIVMKAYNGK
jgi:hypothetical protein